ncbi:hypothetical protein ADK67_15895 [Saccharothrix sp. NRRL B-16348]|nr:hypothetical protein ADK67_15895 [Saccharothrix sp. NRRL B-16348]
MSRGAGRCCGRRPAPSSGLTTAVRRWCWSLRPCCAGRSRTARCPRRRGRSPGVGRPSRCPGRGRCACRRRRTPPDGSGPA